MIYTIALKVKAEEPVTLSSGNSVVFDLTFFKKIVSYINLTYDEDVIEVAVPIRDEEEGHDIGYIIDGSAYLKGHTLVFQVELNSKSKDKKVIEKVNNGSFYPAIPKEDVDIVDASKFEPNDDEDEVLALESYDGAVVVMKKDSNNVVRLVDANNNALCYMYFFVN